jgi:EAL domain-containing protein (putative c-di-GMP-specific phosphodiesterase class I)
MGRCAERLHEGKFDAGFVHFINLSPQFLAKTDLVHALLNDAKGYCKDYNLDMGEIRPIVFEITERQLLSDFEKMRADMQPLLDFGFRLALDDFGSGYSSFLYLAELPISFLKIEGWMIMNMRANERVLSMVQSVVMLARQLRIITIAECIEDQETAEMLRDMGVDWGQGYYFGRPECEFGASLQVSASEK